MSDELWRLGLNKVSCLEPSPPGARYEHSWPDKLLTLNIKRLGRIEGVNHRITSGPFPMQSWGWLRATVSVRDDYSRLAYTELLAEEKAIPRLSL